MARRENAATGRSLPAPLTGAILILAATYIPTQLSVQYDRPCGPSLPCKITTRIRQ
jgi:hypothetical protein